MKKEIVNNKDETEFVRLLNNKRSLKAFFKKLHEKKYTSLKDKVLLAFEEFEEEEKNRIDDENKKEEVIKDAIFLLNESGISKNELAKYINSNV